MRRLRDAQRDKREDLMTGRVVRKAKRIAEAPREKNPNLRGNVPRVDYLYASYSMPPPIFQDFSRSAPPPRPEGMFAQTDSWLARLNEQIDRELAAMVYRISGF